MRQEEDLRCLNLRRTVMRRADPFLTLSDVYRLLSLRSGNETLLKIAQNLRGS
jgi:hypothetical protein